MKKQHKTVMIVDDDHIHLYTVQRQIEISRLAQKIEPFADGASALQFLYNVQGDKQKLPDVILLDLNMPGMDGWKFLQEYMKLVPVFPKAVKLYVVSSSINQSDIERALGQETVVDYLVKPLNRVILNNIFLQAPAA